MVHPSEPAEFAADQADYRHLIITTYGMVVRTDWLREHPWRLVILDEAQAIKNSGTKQTRAVKDLQAESRIAMTGTPIENRLSDLWSLFDFLNPGLLGTAKQFGSFVKRLQSVEPPSFEPLRNLVRPYILRRLKTDKRVIADLPDKTEMKAYCALSKQQVALYGHAVAHLAEQLRASEGMQRRGIVLSQLMRLKQICNHPAQVSGTHDYAPDQSGKFHRLAEIVEEIAARQEKVLVFSQFREITGPLADYLATLFGRSGLVLHGGDDRQETAGVRRSISARGRPALLRAILEGGWHRFEPDGGVARHSLRPLVEPRHREPGHRPRFPDWPEAQRPGPQVPLPGDGRGTDRRDDRPEKPGRGRDLRGRQLGRSLADRNGR